MDNAQRNIYFVIVVIAVILVVGYFFWPRHAAAQYVSQQPVCNSQTTGLKYVDVEGSGFASIFFVIPLIALAPVAGTLASNGQYTCHVAVIGSDAVGAYRKIKNRPQVQPY